MMGVINFVCLISVLFQVSLAASLQPNELMCADKCALNPSTIDSNDTCLFVSLVDQFGDGWQAGTKFSYWTEVGNELSSVMSMSLSCDCALMFGCIHPSEAANAANVSQILHLTVEAGVQPAFFWEVYWTVQILQKGNWRNKYFGGFNTSFSFEYSPHLHAFDVVSVANAWTPETNMSCGKMALVKDAASFFASRLYSPGTGAFARPYSTAEEATTGGLGGYHESLWVLTDTAVSCA